MRSLVETITYNGAEYNINICDRIYIKHGNVNVISLLYRCKMFSSCVKLQIIKYKQFISQTKVPRESPRLCDLPTLRVTNTGTIN